MLVVLARGFFGDSIMYTHAVLGSLTLAILSGNALSAISVYTSDESQMGSITNFADFNGLANFQSLDGYQEDGLRVSASRDYFSWDAPGLDGSEMFYASTGALEMIDISLVNGDDFEDLDMQVSSGWSPSEIGTMYLWIQLYSAGSLIQEFDVDATTGEYIGITGGGFDQVMIGSYASAAVRDLHDSSQRNAIAIDNMSAGIVVPAPGVLAIPALALMGVGRRRG